MTQCPMSSTSVAGGEHGEYFAQPLVDVFEIGRGISGKWQRGLLLIRLDFGAQLLSRSRDSESFFVKQLLDAQHAFHILATIHALTGVALDRLELRKLGLPEAQHVRR